LVTVGEALTEARYQAGLSVDEVSERTKIRGTVIRSIEQDDFEACGGDLFVHGYVRAIAGAIGIDAQPLIRQYDLGRTGDRSASPNGSAGRHTKSSPRMSVPDAAQTVFDLPAVTEEPAGHDAPESPASPADLNTTRFDIPVVRQDPAATSYDLPSVPKTRPTAEFSAPELPALEFPAIEFPGAVPPAAAPPAAAQPPGSAETRYDLSALSEDLPAATEDLMAAGYGPRPTAEPGDAGSATTVMPALGPGPAGPQATAAWPALGQGGAGEPGPAPARSARNNRRGLLGVGALVVLLAGAVLGVHLATEGPAAKNAAASSVPGTSASDPKASASAQASVPAAAQASTSAGAQANNAATDKGEAQPVTSLPVSSVMAFGPDGFADGDDPGDAGNAIASHASQPWTTQWYDTPTFGMLKHGTGLLLDLGGKVTVTSVSLDLSQYPGADLQLRVGNGAALPDLKVAATADNVAGNVKLTLGHPAAARYLLIWFTQLPSNGSGHYQESVSHVAVTGRG
jgi:Helix-turn-helix domain